MTPAIDMSKVTVGKGRVGSGCIMAVVATMASATLAALLVGDA